MLMTTILLAAGILAYALHRRRDVKFNVKVWGANVLLEAKDTIIDDVSGKPRDT